MLHGKQQQQHIQLLNWFVEAGPGSAPGVPGSAHHAGHQIRLRHVQVARGPRVQQLEHRIGNILISGKVRNVFQDGTPICCNNEYVDLPL